MLQPNDMATAWACITSDSAHPPPQHCQAGFSPKTVRSCKRQQASGLAPGPGDMDLDPETGSYKLSASVPGVCMNELRKTLGIRPPPYAVAGAVRGVLHCSGPLEQPVFAGEGFGLRVESLGSRNQVCPPVNSSPCVTAGC